MSVLPQLANIVIGFGASASLFGKVPDIGQKIENFGEKITGIGFIGNAAFVLAILNLLDRWAFDIIFFNGSFPQSLFLFLLGIVLTDYSWLDQVRKPLEPLTPYIGICALIAGLYSIL